MDSIDEARKMIHSKGHVVGRERYFREDTLAEILQIPLPELRLMIVKKRNMISKTKIPTPKGVVNIYNIESLAECGMLPEEYKTALEPQQSPRDPAYAERASNTQNGVLDPEEALDYVCTRIADYFSGKGESELEVLRTRACKMILSKDAAGYDPDVLEGRVDEMIEILEKQMDDKAGKGSPQRKGSRVDIGTKREGRPDNKKPPMTIQTVENYLNGLQAYSLEEGIKDWRAAVDYVFEKSAGDIAFARLQKTLIERGIYPKNEHELTDYFKINGIAQLFIDKGVRKVTEKDAMTILRGLKPGRNSRNYFGRELPDGLRMFPEPDSVADIRNVIGYIHRNTPPETQLKTSYRNVMRINAQLKATKKYSDPV